jgi:hypothetical protein
MIALRILNAVGDINTPCADPTGGTATGLADIRTKIPAP